MPGQGHRHTEVRRKKSWRDSFLIERGVVNSQRRNAKNLYPNISPAYNRLSKDQRLAIECRKPHYSSPCKLYQKWECIHDGYRWRIQKCRLPFATPDSCICPDKESLDFDDWNFDEYLKRPDMLPLKKRKHLNSEKDELRRLFITKEPKFRPETRWKRSVDSDVEELFLRDSDPLEDLDSDELDDLDTEESDKLVLENIEAFETSFGSRPRWKRSSPVDDLDEFDVEGIEQLYHLLDTTVGTKTEKLNVSTESTDTSSEAPSFSSGDADLDLFTESSLLEEREKRETPASFQLGITNECILLPNGSRACFDDKYHNPMQWQEKKERLDGMIKKLRQKLEELKVIRKQLKKAKPNKHNFGQDVIDPYQQPCICDSKEQILLRQQLKDERRLRREDLKKERQLRKEEHMKKIERKMRRKTKFENMTCNAEKMNCFTQDNNHWKTPPLWTEGPFCFCQNANNNTFWCLRTINESHNLLYCEFVTGFITFYDLNTDPYQMRNAVYDLDYGTLETLRMQLNKLRSCKGAKECTMRYKYDGPRHPHRQKSTATSKSRSIRHWRNEPKWSAKNSNSQWSNPERHLKWK